MVSNFIALFAYDPISFFFVKAIGNFKFVQFSSIKYKYGESSDIQTTAKALNDPVAAVIRF